MRVVGVVIAVLALVGPLAADASAAVPAAAHQAATAAAQHKRGNITFGAGPANTKKPDGRTLFTYDSSPGGRLEDHVAILNITHHPEVLRVYTVDVDPGGDGGFFYPPRSAARVGAGAWVAVGTPHAPGLVHAPPRSTTILPIHLTVPTSASPGDHAAAVVVSLTGLVKGKSGQRVKLEQRVATRVMIRVSGALRPQLSIDNLRASFSGPRDPFAEGSATVKYTVRNTGNASLAGTQQVSIHGLFGSTTHANKLPAVPTLLPGGSYKATVHVPEVFPAIRMTAKVTVTPTVLKGDVDPGVHAVSATAHFWAIPWLLIATILLLLIACWAGIRRRRRRNRHANPIITKTKEGVPS